MQNLPCSVVWQLACLKQKVSDLAAKSSILTRFRMNLTQRALYPQITQITRINVSVEDRVYAGRCRYDLSSGRVALRINALFAFHSMARLSSTRKCVSPDSNAAIGAPS